MNGPDQSGARRQIRGVIERLVRDGTAVARSDGTAHTLFPVGISAVEGEALRSWVTREEPSRTIEVGLAYGISALFICEALLTGDNGSAKHVVIDPYQSTRFGDCGLQFLDEAGVAGLVEFHPDESQLALPRFVSEGRQFDFAFVDGNHLFDAVFVDLVYLARLVRPGGIIFLDDYQLPGIAHAASFFVTNRHWTLEEVSTADDLHQWAVLRTSELPDSRPFTYFADF